MAKARRRRNAFFFPDEFSPGKEYQNYMFTEKITWHPERPKDVTNVIISVPAPHGDIVRLRAGGGGKNLLRWKMQTGDRSAKIYCIHQKNRVQEDQLEVMQKGGLGLEYEDA